MNRITIALSKGRIFTETLPLLAAAGIRPAEDPDIVLVATGSEVHVALEAAEQLAAGGIHAQVTSLPCWELLAEQASLKAREAELEEAWLEALETLEALQQQLEESE